MWGYKLYSRHSQDDFLSLHAWDVLNMKSAEAC